MSKKMVLNVDAVAKLCVARVKSMAMDGEKLTVVGDVDVVCVAKALRKAQFTPVVLSVGPEKEEKKPEPKKDGDDKKPPPCCAGCSSSCCCPQPPPPVALWPGKVVYCEPAQPGCAIL